MFLFSFSIPPCLPLPTFTFGLCPACPLSCSGANHRAAEGSAWARRERKDRRGGVHQKGAERAERESVSAAGWAGWSRGIQVEIHYIAVLFMSQQKNMLRLFEIEIFNGTCLKVSSCFFHLLGFTFRISPASYSQTNSFNCSGANTSGCRYRHGNMTAKNKSHSRWHKKESIWSQSRVQNCAELWELDAFCLDVNS